MQKRTTLVAALLAVAVLATLGLAADPAPVKTPLTVTYYYLPG